MLNHRISHYNVTDFNSFPHASGHTGIDNQPGMVTENHSLRAHRRVHLADTADRHAIHALQLSLHKGNSTDGFFPFLSHAALDELYLYRHRTDQSNHDKPPLLPAAAPQRPRKIYS